MRIVTLLAAAGLAYAAYALISQNGRRSEPPRRLPPPPGARPTGGAADGNFVRDAGPDNIRRDTSLGRLRDWDKVDETSDESFPASDPPARW